MNESTVFIKIKRFVNKFIINLRNIIDVVDVKTGVMHPPLTSSCTLRMSPA